MADLTEYQEKVIETISTLDDVPMALLFHGPNGPEMFLQNDHRDRGDFSPHVQLLSAYVVQLARETDSDPGEILQASNAKINEWAEDDVGITAEERGGPDLSAGEDSG